MGQWQAGVDVGGTFTDLLFVDEGERRFRVTKVPSTPDDQSRGMMTGIRDSGLAADALGSLVHGTTVATNAVLERKGVVCGLITTAGFRDVLELGRRTRPIPLRHDRQLRSPDPAPAAGRSARAPRRRAATS